MGIYGFDQEVYDQVLRKDDGAIRIINSLCSHQFKEAKAMEEYHFMRHCADFALRPYRFLRHAEV